MRLPTSLLPALLLALLTAPSSAPVLAQEADAPVVDADVVVEEAPATEAVAESESGSTADEAGDTDTGTDTESAAAEPAAPTPRPAELARMAPRDPLLKVVRAGANYVAVGARGHVLLSADANAWRQVAVPVDAMLTSIQFADDRHGWAVGHDAVILGTRDGGETWTVQHFAPELGKPLFDVLFTDAERGVAVGAYGLMLETRDGGTSWTAAASNPLTEPELHINALNRLADGRLIAVGEAGLIAVSADAGSSWTRLESPYDSSLFSVIPAGDHGAIIGGLRGNAFLTLDAGAGPWTRIDTGTVQSVFGMAALPGGRVALVGLNATLLLLSADGGIRRVPMADERGNPQTDALSWVMPLRDGDLLLVGDAGVQRLPAAKL